MFSWIAMASGLDWRLITHMVVVGTHWLLTSDMQATLSLVVSVSMGQVSCARISERETPITTEVASPTMFSHSTSVFLMGRDYSLLPSGSCGLLADPTTLPNGTTIVPGYCVYSAMGDMDDLGNYSLGILSAIRMHNRRKCHTSSRRPRQSSKQHNYVICINNLTVAFGLGILDRLNQMALEAQIFMPLVTMICLPLLSLIAVQ